MYTLPNFLKDVYFQKNLIFFLIKIVKLKYDMKYMYTNYYISKVP